MTVPVLGRPPATSHAAIEAAAFTLFDRNGFDATTMDDIAAAVGVGRRTLFRYYPSKNEIPWGQFDVHLGLFRRTFAEMPLEVDVWEGVRDAVVRFNRFDAAALPQHRRRMRLLLGTPALVAHSELRYTAWRSVVATYVAQRLGQAPTELTPTLAGRAALAVALSSYEQWLRDEAADLAELITRAAGTLTLGRAPSA